MHGPSWKLDFLLHKCASLPQPKVSEERWKMHSAACPGHCWGDSGGLVLTHVGTALGGAGLRVRESITDQVMLGSGSSLGSNPPPPGELSPSPGRWFRLVPSLTSSSAEPLAVACCLLPSVCTSWPDRDGNSPLDLSLGRRIHPPFSPGTPNL